MPASLPYTVGVPFRESQTCYRARRFQSEYADSVTAVGFARVCRWMS